MHFDFIFRKATVVDGSGARPRIQDVGITGDTITAVGDLSSVQGNTEINAKGLWLTPGFIDAHTHSDAFLLLEPYAPSKLTQGVTTEIGGQCGGSAAPRLNHARLPSDWEAQTYPPRQGQPTTMGPNWTTVADYRSCFEAARPATNLILFAGHNTLRKGVMGDAPRAAREDEVNGMIRNLEQALDEGAWGLTTGLVYHPGVHSQPNEVLALATACAKRGGHYATHMRNEGDTLLEALDEVLELTQKTGIRTQISHLKTSGKANWHKLPAVLEKIEAARTAGLRVYSDRYPYLSAGTDLDIVLPDWASAGGNAEILKRLDDIRTCGRIAAEIDCSGRDPDTIMIGGTWAPETRACSGKTVGQIMRATCRTMGAVITWILRMDRSRTGAFFFGMCEENLLTILKQPWVMPGSDASLRAPWGPLGKDYPHPRAYGTHPKYFRTLTEQLHIAPEEAIRRMTSLPAQAFEIPKRGLIREGFYADLVLLNPNTWRDTADYQRPHCFATGIDTVMVNGSPVLQGGQLNPSATRRGAFLTRQS
ncbi:MAG: D-aminoacylase [Kiritimatiellae bacterium]|nr:D-aminoacylase [Kiritimatiellia bacterium]